MTATVHSKIETGRIVIAPGINSAISRSAMIAIVSKRKSAASTPDASLPVAAVAFPNDRFRSSFGREHSFHVQRGGGGGGGDQRFQYGGYWFEYTDAWPDDWGYDDNFYIDYVDDDYYLYDRRHPGVRILVIVVE